MQEREGITPNSNREDWLDVAKFLGIWAVFVGHFGSLAGGNYQFVYLYQNALFFFFLRIFAFQKA